MLDGGQTFHNVFYVKDNKTMKEGTIVSNLRKMILEMI